jgi:hypothetical protein
VLRKFGLTRPAGVTVKNENARLRVNMFNVGKHVYANDNPSGGGEFLNAVVAHSTYVCRVRGDKVG